MIITGCASSISPCYIEIASNFETHEDIYKAYQQVNTDKLSIEDKIEMLINLSYFGHKTHLKECVEHIELAMTYSEKINHNHNHIGELFILYAKLHKLSDNDYDSLDVMEKGKHILGNSIAKELRKRKPYRKYFKGLNNHENYISSINEGKEYMRNAGYNVGKDNSLGMLYKIHKAITSPPSEDKKLEEFTKLNGNWFYVLRNGHSTYMRGVHKCV